MKIQKSTHFKNLLSFSAFLFITLHTFSQGNLTPDDDPAPSMHSLQEIWDIIQAQEAKLSENNSKITELEKLNKTLQSKVDFLRKENSALLEASGVELPWTITVVDSEGNVGPYASLAYSPEGYPAIAYYDVNNEDLKFASYDGYSWTINSIVQTGWVGAYCSLAYNPVTEQPSIAYYEVTNKADGEESNGKLMFIECHPTTHAWQTPELVKNALKAGHHASLAFTPSGNPAISYVIAGYNNIKYSERNPYLGWSDETVQDGSNSGDNWGYNSLVFSPEAQPCIAYYDGTHHNLCYAWKTDGTWYHEFADDSPRDMGTHASLAISPDGNPTISYRDATDKAIRCATKENDGWSYRIIDDSADVGLYSSLAYSPLGTAMVSYFDNTNYNLILAIFDGVSWNRKTIDDVGDTGRHSCLTFNALGQPSIAYYNLSDHCLQLAVSRAFTK